MCVKSLVVNTTFFLENILQWNLVNVELQGTALKFHAIRSFILTEIRSTQTLQQGISELFILSRYCEFGNLCSNLIYAHYARP